MSALLRSAVFALILAFAAVCVLVGSRPAAAMDFELATLSFDGKCKKHCPDVMVATGTMDLGTMNGFVTFAQGAAAKGASNVLIIDSPGGHLIEGLRLGTRLSVDECVDEAARGCRLLPLLLQPLVENAIRHGIATCPEGGVLRIEARTDGQRMRISVENPFDPDAPRRPGVGVGLANVRRRLLAAYGDRALVEAVRGADRFRVAISMPAEVVE